MDDNGSDLPFDKHGPTDMWDRMADLLDNEGLREEYERASGRVPIGFGDSDGPDATGLDPGPLPVGPDYREIVERLVGKTDTGGFDHRGTVRPAPIVHSAGSTEGVRRSPSLDPEVDGRRPTGADGRPRHPTAYPRLDGPPVSAADARALDIGPVTDVSELDEVQQRIARDYLANPNSGKRGYPKGRPRPPTITGQAKRANAPLTFDGCLFRANLKDMRFAAGGDLIVSFVVPFSSSEDALALKNTFGVMVEVAVDLLSD